VKADRLTPHRNAGHTQQPPETGQKEPETIGKFEGITGESSANSQLDAFAPSLYTSRHPIQVEWTIAVRFRTAAI
jgi:hypothetical protein